MIETDDLMEIVTTVLTERELKWLVVNDESVIVRIRDDHATYDIFIVANPLTRMVWCYCIYSARVPVDRRSAVVELLNLINWRTAIGNFELDMSDGELRFRTTIDVEGGELAPKMMHTLFNACLYNGGRYHETVMRVAFGDVEPAAALTALLETEAK